jgi:branched-chain amino acid transport system permease protein
MDYLVHILILVAIYSILALSLDLIAGYTGLVSISQATFYGLGAYTSALLATRAGVPFVLGVPAGVLVAAAVSLPLSMAASRLRGEYFVVATLAFQMITYSVLSNWTDVTGGPGGVPGVPAASLFGWPITSHAAYLALCGVLALAAYLVVSRLSDSPMGRVLRAIREDEGVAAALGKNTARAKMGTFAVSAGLAATAGALYAHYVSYIDPSSFTVMESILVLSMVIVGGAGSRWGPVVGAGVLVILPELLRFVGLPSSLAADLRQLLYGLLLVLMLLFRPQGLVGNYGIGR